MIFSLAACNNQSNNGANSGNKEEELSAIRKILIKGTVNDEVK